MTSSNHVSAQDISAKWSKVSQAEAASIKNIDSLSAQVQKSYGFDKAKADAEVKAVHGRPHLLTKQRALPAHCRGRNLGGAR